MNTEQRFYFVRAISQRRQAEWTRIFGTDELPVRSGYPSTTPTGCLAYRLDEHKLHWMQRERLVNHLVRRERMSAEEARLLVREGLPIPSADAALVIDEQESETTPAFSFLERLVYTTWPRFATM
ncbi:MAG: hypothetical protein V9G98_22465 [Candidatus Competibacter sp.]